MNSDSRKDSRVGQSASRLVADLQRSQWLPHYDRATLRDVVAEMGELFRHLHHNLDMSRIEAEAGQSSENRTTTITFLDTALRRNRQCVLAYINFRLEKIRELSWQHIGRKDELPDQIKERLDQDELKFSRQYNAVLDQYMIDFNSSDDSNQHDFRLDLMTDLIPPKNPVVEVELIDESLGRPAGSRFLARRQMVEPLVLSCKARHINSEIRSGTQRD
jgi:hypothetical protein